MFHIHFTSFYIKLNLNLIMITSTVAYMYYWEQHLKWSNN